MVCPANMLAKRRTARAAGLMSMPAISSGTIIGNRARGAAAGQVREIPLHAKRPETLVLNGHEGDTGQPKRDTEVGCRGSSEDGPHLLSFNCRPKGMLHIEKWDEAHQIAGQNEEEERQQQWCEFSRFFLECRANRVLHQEEREDLDELRDASLGEISIHPLAFVACRDRLGCTKKNKQGDDRSHGECDHMDRECFPGEDHGVFKTCDRSIKHMMGRVGCSQKRKHDLCNSGEASCLSKSC